MEFHSAVGKEAKARGAQKKKKEKKRWDPKHVTEDWMVLQLPILFRVELWDLRINSKNRMFQKLFEKFLQKM